MVFAMLLLSILILTDSISLKKIRRGTSCLIRSLMNANYRNIGLVLVLAAMISN